ncbi:MAG TPA: serine hydrolase [Sphingomicrobium sp.]|nr:serine hydrolase [Sphingomicrobium sp.]
MRMLGTSIALSLLFAGAQLRAQGSGDLTGIWRADISSGPELRGQLLVRRTSSGYVAEIGGERAVAGSRANEVRLKFGRQGTFRGTVHGGYLEGFWIRPSSNLQSLGDPGGSGSSYATPIRFQQISHGSWRGYVRPLDTRFTLWLSIFRIGDGALTAAFRNPQLNSTGGAARFDVSRTGNSLLFSAGVGDRKITHAATLLTNPERIRIDWKDAGGTLELTRRSGTDAAAFFPRAPTSPPYIYHRPAQLADGWRTADASSVGMDDKALEGVVQEIAASDPTVRGPRLIHSLLIAHHGRLVLEEYFYGFDRLIPHDTRSAAKTFASVLLGTDPARSVGLTPDTRIYDVARGPFANPDPRKAQITLAHLMTHTSGLACNDNDDASPGNEATMQSQTTQPNWWLYTLNLPQLFQPGQRYAYCSANMNLVGLALTSATRIWLPELFRRTIAEPLEFGEWHWNLMPNGEGYLGGGAFLLPRDFLKLGQVYLDGGVWNGRRIVPAKWVQESVRPHIEVTPETTGLANDQFSNFYLRGADGFAWHLGSIEASDRSYRTYSAVGNGGQLLIVVPAADLAVVFTGGNYGQGGVWLRWPQQIVGDKIIPAMHL